MRNTVFLLLLCAALLMAPIARAEEDVMIDGPSWQIPATITLPDGEGPFPFVVMFHGTGSDRHEAGGGYDLLAPKLAEAGIASARFDFAGSGDSPEDYIHYTFSSGVADGNAVIAYMQGLDAIAPDRVGVLGWSQGGTVAMLTAARNPAIRSLVTWAGALDMANFAADQYEDAVENGFTVLAFDWREPLNLSLEWYEEARGTDVAAELSGYDGAVLALAGSLDDVVPPAQAEAIVDAAPTEAKRAVAIEGADHTFNIFSGDMAKFDELAQETVAWFQNTL